jgi:hypothetical protein
MSENGRLTTKQVEALVRDSIPGLKIDQGKIKLREWDDLEDAADRPVTPWVGANFPPLWFIRGVLWLELRRAHPALTFQDLGEINAELLFEASKWAKEETPAAPDPTGGNDEPTGESPPTPSPTSATSGG